MPSRVVWETFGWTVVPRGGAHPIVALLRHLLCSLFETVEKDNTPDDLFDAFSAFMSQEQTLEQTFVYALLSWNRRTVYTIVIFKTRQGEI